MTGDSMTPFNIIDAEMGAPIRTKSGIKILEFFKSKHATPHKLICVTEYGGVLTYSEEGIFGFDEDTRKRYHEMDLVLLAVEDT
jgi:hypothetical protein